MRRVFAFLSLAFIVPLAACFDAELSLNFADENNATATMKMTASADFYAMTASSGEPFCEGGEETELADGSHVCTETKSGTIDEILADPDMGEGMTIERRDGGLLYVAFDLGDLTEDVAPPTEEEGGEEMLAMMKEAFAGHFITLNVSGSEIVETNGTVSDDGKSATYQIPLTVTLDGGADLPETFNVLLKPGS